MWPWVTGLLIFVVRDLGLGFILNRALRFGFTDGEGFGVHMIL